MLLIPIQIRQFTLSKVTQRLFSIDPCTRLKPYTATDKANGKSSPFNRRSQTNCGQIVWESCGISEGVPPVLPVSTVKTRE